MYKKASDTKGISYAEALGEALCFGWIDGQVKKGNDEYYLQKFTPRRARSLWSKRNVEYIERLEKAGKMMPSGKAEVEQARADGRLSVAYAKPSDMTVPDDFLTELAKRPKAKAFFDSLNRANTYAIA